MMHSILKDGGPRVFPTRKSHRGRTNYKCGMSTHVHYVSESLFVQELGHVYCEVYIPFLKSHCSMRPIIQGRKPFTIAPTHIHGARRSDALLVWPIPVLEGEVEKVDIPLFFHNS
ncbi:hypothetical protein AVEN_211746-1 [Araneus ventricosus]|uniref:Uncharacterized protein n=1 Tax=Araneus ventricosus TaxID=182803 RepID=A0A4Y2L6G0_ARAVE|nr:hypothetical protein AVEN_211746-1 [Araneus ventricosus]